MYSYKDYSFTKFWCQKTSYRRLVVLCSSALFDDHWRVHFILQRSGRWLEDDVHNGEVVQLMVSHVWLMRRFSVDTLVSMVKLHHWEQIMLPWELICCYFRRLRYESTKHHNQIYFWRFCCDQLGDAKNIDSTSTHYSWNSDWSSCWSRSSSKNIVEAEEGAVEDVVSLLNSDIIVFSIYRVSSGSSVSIRSKRWFWNKRKVKYWELRLVQQLKRWFEAAREAAKL